MQRARRALALTLITLGLVSALTGCGEPAALRFDGLYHTAPSKAYGKYLRFYEDGAVVSASSTDQPADVAEWLTKAHQNRGAWTLEDGTLRFTCTGTNGKVEYEGQVLTSGLALHIHSHINDNESEANFDFILIEALPETP